jgi:tetratricopeptide (TPR) repeat protein
MKLRTHIALTVGCGLISAVGLLAQSAPPQQQKPPAQQPAQKPPAASNPFPEDTSSVPVVPTTAQPAAPPPASAPENTSAETTSLLKGDSDPARSPDDPVESDTSADGFSSSLAGSGDVNIPDEDRPQKHRRGETQPAVKQVTAKENEDVGEFELGRKNYKAALSRFQSALVTDSENPDVYWGIAEAQRGLGNYADAKANYQKVVDYDDPESKHSKEARKLLKSPQLANAPAVSANQQPPK